MCYTVLEIAIGHFPTISSFDQNPFWSVSFLAVRIILYMLYNLIGLIIVLVKET